MMVLLVVSACATDSMMDDPEVVLPANIDDWTLVDHTPYLKTVKGKPTTVHVGFAQTKASMEMNGENNFAKVVCKMERAFRSKLIRVHLPHLSIVFSLYLQSI